MFVSFVDKKDGSIYTASPVDPVFIMLPIFEEARMKVQSSFALNRFWLTIASAQLM